jgi:hypothetical protein
MQTERHGKYHSRHGKYHACVTANVTLVTLILAAHEP